MQPPATDPGSTGPHNGEAAAGLPSSLSSPTSSLKEDKGLPPVAPPSAKFIAQLFLVPLLIVVGLVALFFGVPLVFMWLVGATRSPEQYLKDLRDTNAEVRWRAASDLAQTLPRNETLASNPGFGLDLADLLLRALKDSETAEQSWLKRAAAAKEQKINPEKSLQDERLFIQFLINCLGNFTVPVGVPLLKEIALTREEGADQETVRLRRQLAVFALARMGENLKRYDGFGEEKRTSIIDALHEEQLTSNRERADWVAQTMTYLKDRLANRPQSLGVAQVLAQCADGKNPSNDPLLRKYVALALAFWEGNAAENELMEKTLLSLSYDDGHGGESAEVPVRGLEIRYKAAEVLARRGSSLVVPRFPVLMEMLDEEQQAKNFRVKPKGGQEVAEDTLVYSTVRGALRGLAELHHKKPDLDLSRFHSAVEKLLQSNNRDIRLEAERAKIELGM